MKEFRSAILGIVVIIVAGVGAWLLVDWVVADVLPGLNPNVAAALLVALGATITALWVKRIEHRHTLQAQFRTQKAELYVSFRNHLDALSNTENPPTTDQSVEYLKDIRAKVMFWSGPKLVNEFEALTASLKDAKIETVGDLANAGRAMGKFYLAMRKDLGLSNWNVNKESLGLGFMLRHPKLLLEMEKVNPDVLISELTKVENRVDGKSTQHRQRVNPSKDRTNRIRKRKSR